MKGYAIVNYNYSNEELFNDDLGVFCCSDMMTYPIFSVGVFTNFEEAVNEATCLAEDEMYACGHDGSRIEKHIMDEHGLELDYDVLPSVAIVYGHCDEGEIKVSVYAIHETELKGLEV